MTRVVLPLLLSMLGCGALDPSQGSAGDDPDPASTEGAITNAVYVPSDGRHARANLYGGYCSAELITNEWFLMAGHCFEGNPHQDVNFTWGFGTGRYSQEVYRHPNRDLALVKVSPPMSINGSTTGFDVPIFPWTGEWVMGQRPTAYGWTGGGTDYVAKGSLNVLVGSPAGTTYTVTSTSDSCIEHGDSGGGSFLSNFWGIPQILSGVHIWLTPSTNPTMCGDDSFVLTTDWINRTMFPDQGLVCHDFVCSTTLTSVPDNAYYGTRFAPPCSGAWDYEASFDTEAGYDFLNLDGRVYSGQGSVRATKAAGTYLGIQLTTDYSNASKGLTLLRARCETGSPASGARALLRPDGTIVMLVRAQGNYLVLATRNGSTGVGSAYWSWASLGPQTFASQPVGITTADGRLVVVARGTDGHIWTLTEKYAGSRTFGNWAMPHPSDGTFVGEPAVARDESGRLVLNALDPNGHWNSTFQQTPNGAWNDWTPLAVTTQFTGSPVVPINANGRASLFMRGSDATLWNFPLREDGQGDPSFPNGVSIDSFLKNGDAIGAVVGGDERMTVAVNNTVGGVSYITQLAPGSNQWSFMSDMTGTSSVPFHPVGAVNQDGRAALFVTADGKLQVANQAALNNIGFGNWSAIATGAASAPVALRDARGIIHAFAVDTSGWIHEVMQTSQNSNSWTSWSSGKIGGTVAGL